MLKAATISSPKGQQAALPEMDVCSNLPSAAAALNFEVLPQPNVVSHQLLPQASLEQHQPSEEAEEPVVMEEYNLFRDYLGLFKLVKSLANVPDDFMSLSNADGYSAMEEEVRERRDSLGSAGSEFSSCNSAESVEVADIYYTAYGRAADGVLGLKQAFLESGEESARESTPITTTTIIPNSLLLDHKIIAAKKPQVSKLCSLCIVVEKNIMPH